MARPSRFNEEIKKNESLATELITGVKGRGKQKWQSLNVRDILCPMNILSFNAFFVHIKGAETSYLHVCFWVDNFLTT